MMNIKTKIISVLCAAILTCAAYGQQGNVYHSVEVRDEYGQVSVTSFYVYVPGTTTTATIYKDQAQTLAMTQPVTTSSANTTLSGGCLTWWGPDRYDYKITTSYLTQTNWDAATLNASHSTIFMDRAMALDTELYAFSLLDPNAMDIPYWSSTTEMSTTALSAFIKAFLNDANSTVAQQSLDVEVGVDVQAYDAELAALAGLTSAASKVPYFTGSGTAEVNDSTYFGRSRWNDANEAEFKANTNLEIGVDIQAYDAELAALAGLTSATGKVPYFTGSETAEVNDSTYFGRSRWNDANEAEFKANTNLEIGVDVQAYDPNLTLLAAADPNAGDVFYWPSTTTGSSFNTNSFTRGLLNDANAAEFRASISAQKQYRIDVTEAPYNASGHGETDDTAAIQAAIDAAEAAGGGTVYCPSGKYLLGSVTSYGGSWTASLEAKSNVRLLGDVNTVFVEDKTLGTDALGYIAIIVPDGVEDFSVEGIRFEGSDASTAKGLGAAVLIRVEDGNDPARRITIRQCSMDNLRSFPIYWYSPESDTTDVVIDLTIQDVNVTNSGNHAISGRHVRGLSMDHIYVEQTALNTNTYGIDVSSDSNDVHLSNILIRNCARGIKFEAADGFSERLSLSNVQVIGGPNTIGVGIRIVGASVTMSNCIVDGMKGVGVKVSSGDGESADDAEAWTISNCIIRNITASDEDGDGEGVIIERAGPLTYAGCVFNGNTVGHTDANGVVVMMARCIISDNKIYDFGTAGIYMNGQDMDTTLTPDNCIVSNNHVWRTADANPVFLTSGKTYSGVQYRPLGMQVLGNYFYGGEVDINDVNDLQFSSNRVFGAVTLTDCNGVSFSDNAIYVRSNFTSQAAITLTDCDHFTVTGGLTDTLDYGTYAVETSGTVTKGYVQGVVDVGDGGFSLDANVQPSEFVTGVVVSNGSTSAGYIDLCSDSDIDATAYVRETIAIVDINNAEIKDLHDTPITLVAAPGSGMFLEFCGASLWLDYGGTNVFTEPSSPDDLVINYDDASGPAASAAIVASGFITANADTGTFTIPVSVAGTAAADLTNQPLVLYNSGEDYTGNAGNDNVMRVIVKYRVHSGLGL